MPPGHAGERYLIPGKPAPALHKFLFFGQKPTPLRGHDGRGRVREVVSAPPSGMMPLQDILDGDHPVRFLSFPRMSGVVLLRESVSGRDCNLRPIVPVCCYSRGAIAPLRRAPEVLMMYNYLTLIDCLFILIY